MTVGELFLELEDVSIEGDKNRRIAGLCYDSRKIRSGDLFFAVPGGKIDGHAFIADAIHNGASAVVLSRSDLKPQGVTLVRTANVRKAMGVASSAFYNHPSRSMVAVGVTGTNGKTTTTYVLESIWSAAGCRAGVIGTISYRFGGRAVPASHTTPESVDLQRTLWEMKREGVSHAVLEISSHALAMERVRGLSLDAAIFTNLSRDHLDFHQDMEEYFAQKSRLFTDYLPEGRKTRQVSVINGDDSRAEALRRATPGEIVLYGLTSSAVVRPDHWEADLKGLRGSLFFGGETLDFSSRLIGQVNLYNILAAAAAAWALGVPLDRIKAGIAGVESVPGRMEAISGEEGPTAFVDYAHTPDALEQAIRTLRPLTAGRLVTVFGCGGDRDRGKRPLMGGIAARLSDLSILTSDNPRSEDPDGILNEIEEGVRRERCIPLTARWDVKSGERAYTRIRDRREAVFAAILRAGSRDVILIAGKGHEDYQIVGEKRFPCDDRELAREALAARGARA
jgi:UDP-N-acetylmuramoyl-L-alanyl-D-glutamate--2,6-diaminopimelate ligase